MGPKTIISAMFFIVMIASSCMQQMELCRTDIIFLHHSTGDVIWRGGGASFMTKAARKISSRLADFFDNKARLPQLFEQYNKEYNKSYCINEIEFPKTRPYGWKNYPFDYFNIWVRNSGEKSFKKEPTLEILTKKYKVIIFKHCFPVSNIQPDAESPDINSEIKTISNYKLQYLALRDKLLKFPDVKFIVFTGAAQVKSNTTEEEGVRAKEFFSWVTSEWDLPDDNIYIWDLYSLETEGTMYLKNEYALSSYNSHPNDNFAARAVQLLFNRIIDVIENNGKGTTLTGEKV